MSGDCPDRGASDYTNLSGRLPDGGRWAPIDTQQQNGFDHKLEGVDGIDRRPNCSSETGSRVITKDTRSLGIWGSMAYEIGVHQFHRNIVGGWKLCRESRQPDEDFADRHYSFVPRESR
jgi:hypothetical protein